MGFAGARLWDMNSSFGGIPMGNMPLIIIWKTRDLKVNPDWSDVASSIVKQTKE
jgi:hypothetical protein